MLYLAQCRRPSTRGGCGGVRDPTPYRVMDAILVDLIPNKCALCLLVQIRELTPQNPSNVKPHLPSCIA